MKKRYTVLMVIIFVVSTLYSCAIPPERYNTQKGAAIGAGLGAVMGQAIGRNTRSTLLGTGVGMLLGSLVGNVADQDYNSGRYREYGQTGYTAPSGYGYTAPTGYAVPGQRVVYQTTPYQTNQQTRCRKIIRRTWEGGSIVKDTIEEICEGDRYTDNY